MPPGLEPGPPGRRRRATARVPGLRARRADGRGPRGEPRRPDRGPGMGRGRRRRAALPRPPARADGRAAGAGVRGRPSRTRQLERLARLRDLLDGYAHASSARPPAAPDRRAARVAVRGCARARRRATRQAAPTMPRPAASGAGAEPAGRARGPADGRVRHRQDRPPRSSSPIGWMAAASPSPRSTSTGWAGIAAPVDWDEHEDPRIDARQPGGDAGATTWRSASGRSCWPGASAASASVDGIRAALGDAAGRRQARRARWR